MQRLAAPRQAFDHRDDRATPAPVSGRVRASSSTARFPVPPSALAVADWLKRRVESNGELAWWWTPQAEAALDVNRLLQSVEGREN
jgi:hypothetical protein